MAELQDLTERQLGDYRLLRRVGRGATSEVYLAEQDNASNPYVAVKVLRPDIVDKDDNKMLERFQHEAKAARVLNHPNIVQVYKIDESDGLHYIAQEFVHGRNLSELLRRNGPPATKDSLHIIRQVATALQAAHEAGVVHRDIKPENIMLTREGRVKVADFGLAQLSYGSDRGNLTQEGMTIGTPMYMSPEQANGRKLDLRSDIYSLGVTAYHMFAGSPPFTGPNPVAIAVQHVNDEPELLHKRRAKVPEVISRFVHKMMAKDPARRYQSAQGIMNDVNRILSALEGTGATSKPATSGSSGTEKSSPGAVVEQSESKSAVPRSATPSKATPPSKRGAAEAGSPASTGKPTPTNDPRNLEPEIRQSPPAAEQTKTQLKPMYVEEDEEEEDGFAITSRASEEEEMDLTPMVDVTFLLLIFFMITASFTTQKAMEVPAPDPDEKGASAADTMEDMKEESIIVFINEENVIFVDDDEVDVADLVDTFESKMQTEDKREMAVEADKKSINETFVQVVDAAKEAGLQKIRVAVRVDE